MLKFFSFGTNNYALSLLFYALVFKILFLPFSIKQQRNSIKMAKLTPKIALIKAKYKGRTDQVTMRKQQEEIMALQQQEGYSPLSGCLPLLLQMPIIIFLYNVIRNPLQHIAKFSTDAMNKCYDIIHGAAPTGAIDQIKLAGEIQKRNEAFPGSFSGIETVDVSLIPNFNLGPVDLSTAPRWQGFVVASLVFLIPFIAAGLQWVTVWITKKFGGQSQQMALADQNQGGQARASMMIMDLMMPAMTLWFTFSFSALMGLYWIYQSIFSIIQTIILAFAMPVPKFSEEEIKAIRKAEKDAEKEQKAIIKAQPKYKSLHYIDDDDYDDLAEIKTEKKNDSKKSSSFSDKPEIKD